MSADKMLSSAITAGLDPKLIAKLAAAAGAVTAAAPAVEAAVHAVAGALEDKPVKPKATKKPARGR